MVGQYRLRFLLLLIAIWFVCLIPLQNIQENPAWKDERVLLKGPQPVSPTRSNLPSFAKGGVIFFLHIPKSGGVSLRQALKRGRPGTYVQGDRKRIYTRWVERMDNIVTKGTKDGEIVFFELHGADCPPFMEVASQLTQWKATAREHNIPFFAFTVLRDPTSFAISYFNFYHATDWGDEDFEYFEDPTEADFSQTVVWNPQCLFLTRGERAFTDEVVQKSLYREECEVAYDTIFQVMDWVGTTDKLSTETFPLLQRLVASNTRADHLDAKNLLVKNKSFTKVGLDDLSKKALTRVRKFTRWDSRMQERITQHFSLDMWNDFHPTGTQ